MRCCGRSFLTYPLMVGIQIDQRPHRPGHAATASPPISRAFPALAPHGVVGLLLVANTINIAADIGAMGAALQTARRRLGPRLCRRLRPAVPGAAGLRAVTDGTCAPEMADPGPVRLRRRRVRGARCLGRQVSARPRPAAARRSTPDVLIDGGRGVRHHHQPLPVLLAGSAGGGGTARPTGRRCAAREHAGAGAERAIAPHPDRHLRRHGVFQPRSPSSSS